MGKESEPKKEQMGKVSFFSQDGESEEQTPCASL